MLPIITALVIFYFAPWWISLLCVAAVGAWIKLGDADVTTTICHQLYMRAKKPYEGKTIWLTGASSGIGEFLAYEFAKQGAKLILSARREAELRRVKGACANSNEHSILVLDVADTKSHAEKVAAALKLANGGQIDILVNNAGRSQRGLVEQTLLSVDEAQLQLNTVGTISLTKAMLPHWLETKSRHGHVVVVSSIAGKLSSPGSASYSMSKHALHGFFDSLRIETYKENVAVTLVCPGPVVSEGANQAITATGGVAAEEDTPASSYDNRRIPTDRFASIMAAAMHARLHETWISRSPELLYTYLSQYAPAFYAWLSCVFGQGRIKQYKKTQ